MADLEKKLSLDEYLSHLIAEVDGVKPEEVTIAYILKQRQKRFYPKDRNRLSLNQLEESIDESIQTIIGRDR